MIIVPAILASAISSSRNELLCELHIINDETGTRTRRNYNVILYSRGKRPRQIRSGRIENWPSEQKSAWRLIQEAWKVLGE